MIFLGVHITMAESERQIFRIGSNKPIIYFGPTIDYPSTWFEKHQSKPPLSLPRLTKRTSDYHRMIIKLYNESKSVPLNLALAFLHSIIKEKFLGTLNEEWKSFGQLIGTANQEVSPLDLVNLQESDDDIEIIEGAEPREHPIGALLFIVGIYRIWSMDNNKERDMKLINNRQAQQGCYMPIRQCDIQKNDGWYSNHNYTTSIVIIDMFLNRFPTHPYTAIRIGTETSRFRDCGALKDLQHLLEITNMDITQAKEWLWVPALESDFIRLDKPGQEVGQMYSYAPYMVALRLISINPYTVKQNPSIHFFAHVVAATLGSERSQHARMVGDCPISPLMKNARAMAYAFQKAQEAEQQHNDGGQWNTPKGYLDAMTLLSKKYGSSTFAKHVDEELYAIWRTFRGLPEKTIGKFLSEYQF
jgi:Rhabdovirus nucleocapsid protein